MQGFWWFHKFVYDQHIIQSSVSFIPVLTFPLNFIIVVIILFTIIKIKNMYSFSTHQKELLRTWNVLDKPEIFSPQKCKTKIIISYYKEFLIMKYSTKLSDTVHVMVLIAINQEKSLSSASIAESIHTNPGFVRQLMLKLKKAGLMTSVAGHAHPSLSKPADQITLLDIYKAVEGEKPLLHLDTHTNPDCGVGINIQLSLQGFYNEIQKNTEEKMNTITLQDIINTYYQRTSMQNDLQNII